MLLESPPFPFVALLEKNLSTIRGEAERLSESDYADWPLEGSYEGNGWKVLCLVSRDADWIFASACDRNSRRCPRTAALLARIPGIVRGGFSMLLPGTHILEHTDARTEDSLRCHLGLKTNDQAKIRVGNETTGWVEGRCMLFDGSVPHESANLGTQPRVVLLVDVERNRLEEKETK